tara:strand:- start:290 stop:1153 length:864 start_codon:yes stop_codon:yes gene_type:complete
MDNFHKQILENRNNIREKNLIEDLAIWNNIVGLDQSKAKLSFENNKVKCQVYSEVCQDRNERKDLEEQIITFVQQIFRIHSHYFKVNAIEDIELSHVKEYTQWILDLDEQMQLHFCKNPTRQNPDERFQIKKLDENISTIGFHAKKPKKHIYIFDGKTYPHKIQNNMGLKSVDVIVSDCDDLDLSSIEKNSNLIFFGYCKTVITGGGHQGNQFADVEGFIKEAYKFNKKHPTENIYFFAQLDGDEAIKNTPIIQESSQDDDKIFVGSTMSLIKWILEIYEKKKVQVS